MLSNLRPNRAKVAEVMQVADPRGDLLRHFRVLFDGHYLVLAIKELTPDPGPFRSDHAFVIR